MRKPIQSFKAIVVNNTVELSWFKSSSLFEDPNSDEFSIIRIYRREESFIFGEDYEEFFLNMKAPSDTELIFEGNLELINNRKFIYHDLSPKLGHTYSYWVQTKTSNLIGPIPVKVRDSEVWWSYEKIMCFLSQLKNNHPQLVQLSICGQTTRGSDIPCIRVGKGACAIGLVGAIHAGESGPELIIPVLEKLLKENVALLNKVQIVAIPSVNIDSREAEAKGAPWYIRTNANGVDLNRNFPAHWDTIEYGYGLDSSEFGSVTYRGHAPASASETKAVISIFENESPKVVFGFHALASISGLPALASKYGENCEPYVKRCQYIIDIFGNAFYPELKYTGKRIKFSGTSGSMTTWLFEKNQIPAFDFEMGVDKEALQMCLHDHTDLVTLKDYQNRHYQGILALLNTFAKECATA